MNSKLTIRSKLAAALALPLIALAVFVGFQLRDESQVVYILSAVGAVGLSVFVLFLANVLVTKPLKDLADDALEAANERLPEIVSQVLAAPTDEGSVEIQPVQGRGGAEIIDVADALNVLQQRAVDLATEQAALRRSVSEALVNLGRRTQQLLSRQIELISQLESKEQNPELLEQLFKLDHLATRMRRNAESLLVLAGEEAPRQWRAAQPVGDLVRASLGEVEDYARVRIHQLDSCTIVGHAVADLSHVLAELLENGLSFSPPDSVVDLYGRLTPNGYVVSVNDHGIGMAPEELAIANERLVMTNALTLAPSRYLGHYVVGQLTARHNVAVALTESPGGGVTATIVIPPELVEGFAATTSAPAETISFEATLAEPVTEPEPAPEPEPIRGPAYLDAPPPQMPTAPIATFDFSAPLEPDPEPVEPEPVAYVAPELVAPVEPEPVTYVAPEPVAPVAPEPEVAPAPQPVATTDASPSALKVSSFLVPAEQQAALETPPPAPEPEPQPDPLRASTLPPAEPYAELVEDRRAREASEITGAVEEMKESAAAAPVAEYIVDDLLPKLPRRRDGKHKSKPIVTAPLAPKAAPSANGDDGETTEAREPGAPVSEEVQSNMAVYAAFRAAAERGREDAQRR